MTYSDEVLADSPRAYWPTVADAPTQPDLSGNDLDATSTHNSFKADGPKGGGALAYLSDSSEFFDIGTLDGWRTGPFATGTIEMWVRSTDDRLGRYLFGNNTIGPRCQIEWNRGSVNSWDWQFSDEFDNRRRWRWTFPSTIIDGEWHHIAIGWSSADSDLTVVLDGVEMTSGITLVSNDTTSTGADSAEPLHFAQTGPSGGSTICDLAKMAIYNDRLTVTRIQAHYNAADDEEVAIEPGFEFSMIGAVTPTTATIKGRLEDPPETGNLRVQADPELDDPLLSLAGVEIVDDVWEYGLTGLAPNTKYYYGFGVAQVAGEFTTALDGAGTFSIALASCNETSSNRHTFHRIWNRDPAFFLHMGDWGYPDIEVDDPTLFYTNYKNNLTQSNQKLMFANTPMAYMWDDHDFGANNADGSSPSRPAALTAYRQYVPHYPIPFSGPDNDTPISQTWVWGRVRFVTLDQRSESDHSGTVGNGILIGTEQLNWIVNLIETFTEPVMVLDVSVPWIIKEDGANWESTDNWGHAWAEREAIADAIENFAKDRVIIVHGDMHAVAHDDGTNTQFAGGANGTAGGPPLFCFAPLEKSNSTKGGPYTHGPFTTHGTNYGLMTFVDDGSEIVVTTQAYGSSDDSTAYFSPEIVLTYGEPEPPPDVAEYPLEMGFGVEVDSSRSITDKPHIVTWFHAGSWWLLSYHDVLEGWYVWRWDEAETLWDLSSPRIQTDPLSRFDVCFDGTTAYAAQTSGTLNRLFALTYDDGEWTATLLNARAEGAWGGSGSQSMNVSLVKDSQNRLWWTRFQEGAIYASAWDITAGEWLTTSGGSAPTLPVTDGLILNLDASTLLDTLDDQDSVATWADESPEGHDYVQATGSRQPILVANGVNGKPSVRFDGVDDTLEPVTLAEQIELGRPFTFFVMHGDMPTGTSTEGPTFGRDASTNGFAFYRTSTLVRGYAFSDASTSVSMEGAGLLTLHVQSDGTMLVFKDGIQVGSTTHGTDVTRLSLMMMRRKSDSLFATPGDISHYLIYDRALTTQELEDTNNYLLAKWGDETAIEQTIDAGLLNRDLHHAIAWDNKVGVFYSDEGEDAMRFRWRNDTDDIGVWQTTEVVASSPGIADDHATIVADGTDLYAAWKTSIQTAEEPGLAANKRTSSGWESFVVITDWIPAEWTRPRIAIDSQDVFVVATEVGGGDIALWKSPKSALSFGSPQLLWTSGNREALATPRFMVDATSKLLVVHSLRSTRELFADLLEVAGDLQFDPENLAVIVDGTTGQLSWDASPFDPDDYVIFRRSPPTDAAFDPETDTPVAIVPSNQTTYDDENLPPGEHEYQVYARKLL
jgi:hypothetical protein